MIVRYPRAFPTSVSPIPVFPAVPSTTTPPGFSSPRASKSSTIPRAARSLTDPPGFRNSALPRTVRPSAAESLGSPISGVFPIAPTNPSAAGEAAIGEGFATVR